MKKPVLLLAATMALAGQLFNYSSAFADGSDDEGEYHYISDIIDFRKESKSKIAGLCKGSSNYEHCFLVKEIELRETYGYKYDAVWQTDQRYFTITAINPLRNTARIHYTGKHNEKEYDAYITELYMYWIEDGKITPQLNYLTANTYTDQIRNGKPESGVHVLYSGSTIDGTPLFPTDEETRIQFINDSNLMLSTEKQIYYTTVNNYGEQRSGFYNYNKCAFSEGLECKGAFYYKNNAYSYVFVPSEETVEDSELPLWTMPESEEPEPETESEEPESEEPTHEEPEESEGTGVEQPDSENETESEIGQLNAPDTGSNTMVAISGEAEKKSINSQWWAVVVVISTIIVSSFMTKSHKNRRFSKKVLKKS